MLSLVYVGIQAGKVKFILNKKKVIVERERYQQIPASVNPLSEEYGYRQNEMYWKGILNSSVHCR